MVLNDREKRAQESIRRWSNSNAFIGLSLGPRQFHDGHQALLLLNDGAPLLQPFRLSNKARYIFRLLNGFLQPSLVISETAAENFT